MLSYDKLTREEKQFFSTQLKENPVLKHILDKLSKEYLEKMNVVKVDAPYHELQGVFIAYKAARRVEQDIEREINSSLDKNKKTK